MTDSSEDEAVAGTCSSDEPVVVYGQYEGEIEGILEEERSPSGGDLLTVASAGSVSPNRDGILESDHRSIGGREKPRGQTATGSGRRRPR